MHASGGRLAGVVLNRVSVGEIISSGFSSSTSRLSGGSAAVPMLPAIVRVKLNRPEACPSSRIGTALSATVESGTKVKPMPSPWMKRGSMTCQ